MKKHKVIILGLIILSSAVVIAGLYYDDPVQRGLCEKFDPHCLGKYAGFTEPALLVPISVIVTLIVLLFNQEQTFYSWLKFAIPALALGLAWIFITPTNFVGGGLGLGSSPVAEREGVTWIVSVLFLLISLTIIIVKSLKIRSLNKT